MNREVANLQQAPHRYSLFAALRVLERANPGKPRVGTARRASQVAVRLSQPAFLEFAPAEVAGFRHGQDGVAQLESFGFGMFGPNGPLPMHLTELAYERRRQHADPALADFVNLFQHRMLELFYRAWADSDPAATHDRPDEDRFELFLGSFTGLAAQAARGQLPAIGDHAVLGRAGLFGMQTRPAEALEKLVAGHFGVPVRVESFTGEWLEIPSAAQTRLADGSESAQLGFGATLGQKSWQVQHAATLHAGPLDFERFCDFLPGSPGRAALEELLGVFAGGEWHWRMRLVLHQPKIPPLRLGIAPGQARPTELGWSTWLGDPGACETREVVIDLGAPCLAPPSPGASRNVVRQSRQETNPS